ncbi:MAG: PQQ-binding-like beta-propeller repeat protein [Rubripirellula sp.]
MLANELIDRLERLGLLDQEIIEALREQLDQGGTRVTPEAVAKLLVDNGQLTHFQATKLIGELRSGQYEEPQAADDGDLTAGIDEDPSAEEVVEVVEAVDDVFEAEPFEAEAVAVEAEAVETVTEEVVAANRPTRRVKRPDPEKTIWDSFKIYGYLFIIVLLVLMGIGIYFVLNRESEDEYIGEANKQYDQQNYQAAQDMYLNFQDTFPTSQFNSLARVRVMMTELYKAAQFKQEPWQAVDLAKEKLPQFAEEEGMNEERGNLASLLVDIAANMANAASRAKETPTKQSLLAKLDEHRVLMENPLYLPSSFKVTLGGQIKAVEEARARVQRDINRNIRLDESEASMKSFLDDEKTKEAYDIRKQLLREFPELHDHERMETLIERASQIQKTLVKPSTKLPEVTTDAPVADSIRSVVLTTLDGGVAPDLRGETIYLRAGGSVLAFDGENGQLKWRKFVGFAKDLPPVRLEGGSGVLLSESASLEVFRCGSEDGKVLWRAQMEEGFSRPISVRDDVYVSTESGRLVAVDADSGDGKWATQMPQALEVGPGVDDRANRAYVPGNHSNLYLLNTRDGSCLQSLYIGHDEGTITVPPIPLLGHVFVIENAGSDFANLHVLRVDETGNNMKVAQPAFRLTGNVRVSPIIQGRRLIVLTDRGEVVVYDIEPTADRDQVTVAAKLPAFYEQPTSTQMAVGRSQMWITGTRLGRYELQINTGNVIRDWSLYELDNFIGEPLATDDALVHARMLRGTSAIRVTAADPKTGEEIWHTDVGAPVAMISKTPGAQSFDVVTTQAALFRLDGDALRSGSTKGPIENPGDRAVAIRYEDPIVIDENRRVMLNQVEGQSFAVYDPERETEKLRQVTLSVSSGRVSGGILAAAGGVFAPLDTGRLILMDWRTGGTIGSPFQPASDPAGKVKWTKPIAVPDDPDQAVLASSNKKIYRVRIGEQIRELASKDLQYELIGPTSAVGGTMLGTTSGPAADFVVGFDLGSLDEKFKTLLGGRVLWGPMAAGEVGLLLTDDQKLRAYDASGKERYMFDLPEGKPAGKPILVGNSIVLVGSNGWLLSFDQSSGELIGQSDLGQPISAAPFPIGNRLLVPGTEGVIYIMDMPGS